jgi:hypothetical protein
MSTDRNYTSAFALLLSPGGTLVNTVTQTASIVTHAVTATKQQI